MSNSQLNNIIERTKSLEIGKSIYVTFGKDTDNTREVPLKITRNMLDGYTINTSGADIIVNKPIFVIITFLTNLLIINNVNSMSGIEVNIHE